MNGVNLTSLALPELFELIDLSEAGFCYVLICSSNIYNFRNVETFNEVVSDDVWCANHHVIDVFTRKNHQNAFLQADNWIVFTSIITCHFIIPDANIQESAKGFRGFQSFQMAVVQQVPATLHIDDGIVGLWHVFVRKIDDSTACGQELLFWNFRHRHIFANSIRSIAASA